MPRSKAQWDPHRFVSNKPLVYIERRGYDDGRESLDSDGTYELQRSGYNTDLPNYDFFVDLDYDNGEPVEERVALGRKMYPVDTLEFDSPYAPQGRPYFNDSRARQVEQVSQTGSPANNYYTQKPMNVFDIQVNPVEYLDTRLPMPTLSTPVRALGVSQLYGDAAPVGSGGGCGGGGRMAGIPGGPGTQPALEDNLCCVLDIPSKELRQVREDLGQEVADVARWGLGPGQGVSAELTVAPESGTQFNYGPVAVSSPIFTNTLYDQGFISMSGVPVQNAGKYKDPLTGVEYNAYESALPPPDADYEETLNNPARNVKLAHLQGGWTDNTPRPTKTELLEDDFHFQYDRTINTFGTYDPSRYIEIFERNNRFHRDDEHPDPDGENNLDQLPANNMGNQPGQVKIRPLPYLTPTNRGKWAETTFRDGVNPNVAVGNHQMMVAQTFTTFPCARLENTRMDGGGMEVTQNTTGQMDTMMSLGRRDLMPTQRSISEQNEPTMGPANYVRLASNVGTASYEAPTGYNGTDVLDEAYGSYGATVDGQALTDSALEAPTGNAGTQMVDLNRIGTVQPNGEGFSTFSTQRSAAIEPTHKYTGSIVVDVMRIGTTQAQEAYGQMINTQAVENVNSKNGVMRNDAYGSYGGYNAQTVQTTQTVENLNSKNGVMRDDAYGSYGGDSHGAQNVPAVYAKQDLTKREEFLDIQVGADTTFGRNTGQQCVAANTRFNTKKDQFIDFLMPSSAFGGTESTVGGAQNVGMSTSINTKKEAGYNSQYGFHPVNVDNGTVWYGYYNQTAEKLNYREYGNMQHLVGPASYAFFMSQRECEN